MIINGMEWRICLVSPLHPVLITPWKTQALGVCDKFNCTIYLNNSLSPRKTKEVLCHEIAHAYLFSYNIYLSYYEEELIADLITSYGNNIIKNTNKIYSIIYPL